LGGPISSIALDAVRVGGKLSTPEGGVVGRGQNGVE
jgi:hypothetical protein